MDMRPEMHKKKTERTFIKLCKPNLGKYYKKLKDFYFQNWTKRRYIIQI